jgi:hypothetical protein
LSPCPALCQPAERATAAADDADDDDEDGDADDDAHQLGQAGKGAINVVITVSGDFDNYPAKNCDFKIRFCGK